MIFSRYWSAHQLYFSSLCFSSKISTAARIGRNEVRNGNCVVYGLQHTGESRYLEFVKSGNFCERYSLARSILEYVFKCLLGRDPNPIALICTTTAATKSQIQKSDEISKAMQLINSKNQTSEKSSDSDSDSDTTSSSSSSSSSSSFTCSTCSSTSSGSSSRSRNVVESKIPNLKLRFHQESSDLEIATIFQLFNSLKHRLPMNPLDDLVQQLGGYGKVAEMTGRKSRHEEVYRQNDTKLLDGYAIRKRKAHTSDRNTNLTERELFQAGIKKFAIISDAASTGISLHANRNNQYATRRVQVTLEVPWSADKLIQQFGRTHRSNQLMPPKYIFLQSPVPGEDRFIWAISERLTSMTAITHGDRKASISSQLTTKIIDTRIGKESVSKLMDCLAGQFPFPFLCTIPKEDLDEAKNDLADVGLLEQKEECSYKNITQKKIKVKTFFNRVLGCPIKSQRIINKMFHKMMTNLVHLAVEAKKFDGGIIDLEFPDTSLARVRTTTNYPKLDMIITVNDVVIDHGISWKCLVTVMRARKIVPTFLSQQGEKEAQIFYTFRTQLGSFCMSPNDGKEKKISSEFIGSCKEVDMCSAISMWQSQYHKMNNYFCIHNFMNGHCENKCKVGARLQEVLICSGKLNAVWDLLCKHMKTSNLNIVRVKTVNGYLIGIILDTAYGERIEKILYEMYGQ